MVWKKQTVVRGMGGLGWGVNQWWEWAASEQRPGGYGGVSHRNMGKEHPDQGTFSGLERAAGVFIEQGGARGAGRREGERTGAEIRGL